MSMEERTKSHYESLTRAIGFTRSADRKAAPVLALQIALAGTMAARLENLQPIFASDECVVRVLLWLAIGTYLIFSIAAVVMAAWVYIPRIPRSGRSLIYFEDIASMDAATYVARAKGMSIDMIEEQLLDQNHVVAKIASAKMRSVRWSFLMSGPSGILWLVLMVWGSVQTSIT